MRNVGKIAAIILGIALGFTGLSYVAYRYVGHEQAMWWAFSIASRFASMEASPETKALQADLQRYRAESVGMEPKKAVDEWLTLLDRARKLQDSGVAWDRETGEPFGVASVFAAVPGPAAWPVLRVAASARAKAAPDEAGALTLRYVAEVLAGDRKVAAATLGELDKARGGEGFREELADLRAEAARLYGTPEEIAATFMATLRSTPASEYQDAEVPDLVGLVGEERARAMLLEALARPVRMHVPEGERTRELAWRLALERIESLPLAQWSLVHGVEAAPLYEALERRFSAGAAKAAGKDMPRRYDFRRRAADRYYFLHLVIAGRHADAENALRRLSGQDGLSLPRDEVEALRRAGHQKALYLFLHDLLGRRPEMRAWDTYTREAAYLGRSAEALALVEGILQRQAAPEDVLADLRLRRANALLAAERIEPAVAQLRELLAAPPRQDERTLHSRTEAAIRLAGLGRVLERPELSEAGLAFARLVLALPSDESWKRTDDLRQVFAEYRKLGRDDEAAALARAELERTETPGPMGRFGIGENSSRRSAVVELAAVHGRAERHADVVKLLDESSEWGARDVGHLLHAKDSLGVPIALTAARALERTGKPEAALKIVHALLDAEPGYDPAYEALLALDKEPVAFLNRLYARDKFEERPLIWSAIVLLRQGRHLQAEALIRQAITIDPSDGEEGANDRMRAYAVLAEVLETQGARDQAALFRRAVSAIRLSERSDELHRVGLYQRAFAGYRAALEQFADAYCIQSRLAIRLMEQGEREQAFQHYRRAYELMPASFGRVESHCFGCESVFQGEQQQSLAERVFGEMLAKDPKKPQIHYLLGYLQKERRHYPEAVKRFGTAVELDPEYLNAWKHLHELATRTYVAPRVRDHARLKLIELDPRQRHVRYEIDSVGDFAQLWGIVERAYEANKPAPGGAQLYPLQKSAAAVDKAQRNLPEMVRATMPSDDYSSYGKAQPPRTPQGAMGGHRLLRASARVISAAP